MTSNLTNLAKKYLFCGARTKTEEPDIKPDSKPDPKPIPTTDTNNMATVQGVNGLQFAKGSKDYNARRYQYATSSYENEHRMDPSLIVVPNNKNDIKLAIKYAREKKIAMAVRTGGHQYSGASSTGGPNIQLDVKRTFRGPDDQRLFAKDGKTYVRTSVSWPLGMFNAFLTKNKVFVPTGQCTNVHLGGHVQTGGYGQLARSFGLFGDHVISLEIIDHAGNEVEVTRQSDPELFFALTGGSPGNLGVITHFTILVHRDADHPGSRGVKSLFWYSPATVKRLLDIVAEMADNPAFPPNYDFCVSVLSSSFKLLDLFPDIDEKMRHEHPELFGDDGIPFWPRTIVVYAQWVPLTPGEKPTADTGAWFDRIRKGSLFSLPVMVKPMSQLTGEWLFDNVREFDHPYIKRTHTTASTSLSTSGWTAWLSERIDQIVAPDNNGCWLSAQIQVMNGKGSRFATNGPANGTAYSWRDTSVVWVTDCFYDEDSPAARQRAEGWQLENDQGGVGDKGRFSKADRRVLWGSYGGIEMKDLWAQYFENRQKYERIGKVRGRMDPDGVFTPNGFAVERIL